METLHPDPAEWSVADVLVWLLHGLPCIAASTPNARLPDLSMLAASFTEHEISGHVLLWDVTADFLRQDCHVTVLGHRSTVLSGIRSLRRGSPRYTDQMPTDLDQSNATQKRSRFTEIPSPHVCPGETVVDHEGRKRRKLNLTTTHALPDASAHRQPTTSNGFLPDSKLTLDQLMYGTVGLGEPTTTLSDENIVFESSSESYGTRLFAYRHMLHLYQNPCIQIVRYNGQDMPALAPYRTNFLAPGAHRSWTVFPDLNEGAPAIRVDESMLDHNISKPSAETETGLYDYILAKYPPRFGDSASLKTHSDTTSQIAESEDEGSDVDTWMPNKLSQADIEATVQAAIDEFVKNYEDTKTPHNEAKHANMLWLLSRAPSGKGRSIKRSNQDATQHLTGRLNKLRRDIVHQEWGSVRKLKAQCAVLQPTVDDLQFEKWKTALYRRKEDPARLQTEGTQRRGGQQVTSHFEVACEHSDEAEAELHGEGSVSDGSDNVLGVDTVSASDAEPDEMEDVQGNFQEHMQTDDFKQNQDECHADTDSDTGCEAVPDPSAGKFQHVIQEPKAKTARENAQKRLRKFCERQPIASGVGTIGRIVINVNDGNSTAPVYLYSRLAKWLKPYQVEGVRFLWRETMLEQDQGPGCVLAHTMGLGKTLTALAFLGTLLEASMGPQTVDLLPEDVLPLRTLILCPPSLVQNWRNEINKWCPSHLGFFDVLRLDSSIHSLSERVGLLREWQKSHGILLIGYPLFSNFIQAATGVVESSMTAESSLKTRANEKTQASSPDAEAVEAGEILMKAASIVIADEAHQFANKTSRVSQAVNKLKTVRRIAMTGTPMSNATKEVFAMVDWCTPGYLGGSKEFQGRFGDPIEKGNYADSTHEQKRTAAAQLKVLRKETDPKIDRKDIDVLEGSLPPKMEYVLTVPLTDLQKLIYCKLVDHIQEQMKNHRTVQGRARYNVHLFGWIHLLTLLNNHPLILRSKLMETKTPSTAIPTDMPADIDSDPSAIADAHVSNLGFTAVFVRHLASLMTQDAPLEDSLRNSLRMTLILRILKASLGVGEKVLVFSQSIHTLDFIAERLVEAGIKHDKVDGRVTIARREKAIWNLDRDECHVLLLSTRAAGTGLNIQGASRVIIADYSFNPSHEKQAVGRAYRLGQEKPVFVYRFVTGGTFEDNLYNVGVFKSQLSSKVVDKRNPLSFAQQLNGGWIKYPQETPIGDLKSERGKDPKVLDKILAEEQAAKREDASIRSIQTMETLMIEEVQPAEVEETAEKPVASLLGKPPSAFDGSSIFPIPRHSHHRNSSQYSSSSGSDTLDVHLPMRKKDGKKPAAFGQR